jgi:hypothetical protein
MLLTERDSLARSQVWVPDRFRSGFKIGKWNYTEGLW